MEQQNQIIVNEIPRTIVRGIFFIKLTYVHIGDEVEKGSII